eukprot:8067767-Lingulodinium_polyedra.AAC.1
MKLDKFISMDSEELYNEIDKMPIIGALDSVRGPGKARKVEPEYKLEHMEIYKLINQEWPPKLESE